MPDRALSKPSETLPPSFEGVSEVSLRRSVRLGTGCLRAGHRRRTAAEGRRADSSPAAVIGTPSPRLALSGGHRGALGPVPGGAGAPVGPVEPQHVAAAAGLDRVVVGQPAADRPGPHRRPEVVPPAATVATAASIGREWATSIGPTARSYRPATAFIDDYRVAAASEGVGNRTQAAVWRVTGLPSPL